MNYQPIEITACDCITLNSRLVASVSIRIWNISFLTLNNEKICCVIVMWYCDHYLFGIIYWY